MAVSDPQIELLTKDLMTARNENFRLRRKIDDMQVESEQSRAELAVQLRDLVAQLSTAMIELETLRPLSARVTALEAELTQSQRHADDLAVREQTAQSSLQQRNAELDTARAAVQQHAAERAAYATALEQQNEVMQAVVQVLAKVYLMGGALPPRHELPGSLQQLLAHVERSIRPQGF